MKREILFRGFNSKHKEWRYGYYFVNRDQHFIVEDKIETNPLLSEEDFAVNPETIGQYTGLTDKNGVKIFEGDIISIGDPNIRYIIMWRNDGFCAKQIGASSYIGLTYWASDIEVLGNVIDNPELIK